MLDLARLTPERAPWLSRSDHVTPSCEPRREARCARLESTSGSSAARTAEASALAVYGLASHESCAGSALPVYSWLECPLEMMAF